MARRTSTATVRIEAEDRASGTVGKVQRAFGNLGDFIKSRLVITFADLAAIGRTLADVFSASVKASTEYEQALKGLETAASRFEGRQGEIVTAAEAQANALQKVTGVSNDAIVASQRLLLELGVQADQLGTATQAALDLSSALGISLESAARNVGRTVGGFAGELGEIIPELKDLGAEALKAGAGIEFIAQQFEGRAVENAKTFQGSVNRLNSALGDFQKILGRGFATDDVAARLRGLAVVVERFNEALDVAPEKTEQFGKSLIFLKELTDALAGGFVQLGKFIADEYLEALGNSTEATERARQKAQEAADELRNLGGAARESGESLDLAAGATNEFAVSLDSTVDFANTGVAAFGRLAEAANRYATAAAAAAGASERFGESSSAGLSELGGGAANLRLSVEQLFELDQNVRNTLPIRSGGVFRVNPDGSRTLISGNFIRNQSFNGRG